MRFPAGESFRSDCLVRRACGGGAFALAALMAAALCSCATVVGNQVDRFSGQLSTAILDQEDPELVREGLPSYLILVDALARSSPMEPGPAATAAELYAVYGTTFVSDPERARIITGRAAEYGSHALCLSAPETCGIDSKDYSGFVAVVDRLKRSDGTALFGYAVSLLAYIRAHSSDLTAIAALPRVEYALQRLLTLANPSRIGVVNMYLGILNTLRPEALGGRPEQGRAYFEKAIELTQGNDLTVKVEFARSYARLVYDRELHDRLLNEVLQQAPRQPGLTLFNVLAQRQAKELLASADDYF